MVATLVMVGALGLPSAGAAPVVFSPTPVAGWSTNGTVKTVLIVGDTVYAGGDFTQVRGPGGSPTVAKTRVAAFDRVTGAVRTGFTANANGFVRKLATDGTRLFLGGSFTTINGVTRQRLAAVDPTTGAVNPSWTANTNSHVYAMKVSGSRLLVGGAFTTVGGSSRNYIAAVSTTTGAVDPAFNPNANYTILAITASPDGTRVYAGGEFSRIGGGSRRYIATLSATTGALQPLVFQYSTYGEVIDLDISPSGDRVFAALGDLENQAIAWSTVSGNRLWFHIADGDTQSIRYWDGNVYFGFHEGDIGDHSVRMLVADATTGTIVPTYRLPINSFYGVWAIDASADALVIGGEFTSVNGRQVQGVAILPTVGTPPPPPPPPPPGDPVTTTLVPAGSAWRYLDNGTDQEDAWRHGEPVLLLHRSRLRLRQRDEHARRRGAPRCAHQLGRQLRPLVVIDGRLKPTGCGAVSPRTREGREGAGRRRTRRIRRTATARHEIATPSTATGPPASVPVTRKCTVASPKSGRERTWMRRQMRGGIQRRVSDVTSTASSRYIDTMPQATQLACHEDANGTSTSARPKWTEVSSMIATTCTAVKITARPPRNRCRSRVHDGATPPGRSRVERSRPHRTLAASNVQATIPPARAVYHQSWLVI